MSDYTTADDAALVRRALLGERAALGELLARHYPSTLGLCRRLLGVGPEAEDVAQDAALAACVGLRRLREPERFGAWLHAVAANLARGALRRRRALSLEALGEGPAIVTLWSAAPPDPAETALLRELHDAIVAALGELSPLSREAVIGLYLEGYSYAELAALLGVPVGTLKGRLVFGRRQLRGRLQALSPAGSGRRLRTPVRKEQPVEQPLVPMMVDSVRLNTMTQHRSVVLREVDGERVLPIWIGAHEGDAIAMALGGHAPLRPMTHDLSLSLLEPLGAKITRVVITRISDNMFFADVELVAGDSTHNVDARPSDAIALAVRAGAPVLVSRAVLKQAGVTLDQELERMQAVEVGMPLPPSINILLTGFSEEGRDQIVNTLFVLIGPLEIMVGPEDEEQLLQLARMMSSGLLLARVGEVGQIERVSALRAANPKLPLIVLGPDDAELRAQAAQLGVLRYLLAPASAEDIQGAVRAAAQRPPPQTDPAE